MEPKGTTLIFGGMARLPKEIAEAEVFQVIAEVEVPSGKVLEAEFIPCPPLIMGMLKEMMVGISLPNDLHDLLQKIEQRLFHRSKKAVIVAIKDMAREYRESQMPKSPLPSNPDPFNR